MKTIAQFILAVAVLCGVHTLDGQGLRLLDETNLVYQGAFSIPLVANGVSTSGALGTLALRHVNGKVQFFSTNKDDGVYEVNDPGVALTAPYPTATLVHNWKDAYTGKRCIVLGSKPPDCSNAASGVYGLYYDEVDQRLYWTFGPGYAYDSGSPMMGYSTLNDATNLATGVGSWKLAGTLMTKATRGGMLGIPSAFAQAYTNGKRLGIGFGGYYNIGQDTSMGPTLFAIDPPSLPHLAAIPNMPLEQYPAIGPLFSTTTDRGHRNANYIGIDWPAKNGVGYFQWTDTVLGGAWIKTAGIEGVLYLATLGEGTIGYSHAKVAADHRETWAFVVDPADLAKVAQGTLAPYRIQPKKAFRPSINTGAGMAYDATTQTLYVIDPAANRGRVAGTPLVFVYKVADAPTPTAPKFITQPADQTVTTTKSLVANFAAIVEGNPRPWLTWQVNTPAGSWTAIPEGFNIPTAYGARMSYAAVNMESQGKKVRLVATNANGSATSTPATITMVGPTPAAPSFVTQPASQTATVGQNVVLSAVVAGVPMPQDYQWELSANQGKTWTQINSPSLPTWTLRAVKLAQSGTQYRLRLTTTGFPPVYSSVVTLTVK